MNITKKQLRDIIKEELNALALGDTAADGQMLDNLRSGVIQRLVEILEELDGKADTMGVNASDIIRALQDCIQRIQEEPMSSK